MTQQMLQVPVGQGSRQILRAQVFFTLAVGAVEPVLAHQAQAVLRLAVTVPQVQVRRLHRLTVGQAVAEALIVVMVGQVHPVL